MKEIDQKIPTPEKRVIRATSRSDRRIAGYEQMIDAGKLGISSVSIPDKTPPFFHKTVNVLEAPQEVLQQIHSAVGWEFLDYVPQGKDDGRPGRMLVVPEGVDAQRALQEVGFELRFSTDTELPTAEDFWPEDTEK